MKNYYLGFDVGTNSVGYAATTAEYEYCKYKGMPVAGVNVFETAKLCDERRMLRSSRRRLDRRQQRVLLLQELFAPEIAKIDEKFFIRIKESALWREDKTIDDSNNYFNDPFFKDAHYYQKYPTIHHLICELMNNAEPHDARLVYIACAWLVAHRGHFLSAISDSESSNILDFTKIYDEFTRCFSVNPWPYLPDEFGNILKRKCRIREKEAAVYAMLFNGKKGKNDTIEDGENIYSIKEMITLLCGGTVSLHKLFLSHEEYAELGSISLGKDNDELERILGDIGDDAALILRMKAMYDWAVLSDILSGYNTISSAKVAIYDTHSEDLEKFKLFVRKYIPDKYKEIFKLDILGNYTTYSMHTSLEKPQKRADKQKFNEYVKKLIKDIKPDEADSEFFNYMMTCLDTESFLKKQRDSDNRVIPFQLYFQELNKILANAEVYLPFLKDDAKDGISVSDKIRSIFKFKIPYYVGPLNANSDAAWIKRKAGKILPWNFEDMVDFDASEEAFIRNMTNQCTYLPGEYVLPKNSLLYSKYEVLNEINNLKISGNEISVSLKQEIFEELFKKNKKVTRKRLENYLRSHGYIQKDDVLSGIDIELKSSLKSYNDFYNILSTGTLNEEQIEKIIYRITCTTDKGRLICWLQKNFPNLEKNDIRYISNRSYKDFGRLSEKLLCELQGADKESGQVFSVIDAMWETNSNLMQLLSNQYTFSDEIKELNNEYYRTTPPTIESRLADMYVSNAVKRPILRTLDIFKDVVKVMGNEPKKIFIEMARGTQEIQKGKRTKTRRQQIEEIYRSTAEDVRELSKMLEGFTDSQLQSDKLFLYFTQFGKSMYSEEQIDLFTLMNGDSKVYDIDHIWPQSKVYDDSIFNNKVLVLSTENGAKGDKYPIDAECRHKRQPFWKHLLDIGAITETKYSRLIRNTPFSDDEKWGFINRQLTETRQATKALTILLGELSPNSEIVYVRAGIVSEFRHDFDMLKSRTVNDLHHAKDAYLNVVVGNVWHERFTRRWFETNKDTYNLKVKTLFGHEIKVNGATIWEGEKSLGLVKKMMENNRLHFVPYTFCRKGGLFDQQPRPVGTGIIQRKKNLDVKKYGGYAKSTASFFVPVKYCCGKKNDLIFMPVELAYAEKFKSDTQFAKQYAEQTIGAIINKSVETIEFPLGMRILKINTVIQADGFRFCIAGKDSGGSSVLVSPMAPLFVGYKTENYIKKLESYDVKKKTSKNLQVDEKYDGITREKNTELYDYLLQKLKSNPYSKRPNNAEAAIEGGREKFNNATLDEQVLCLNAIISIFGRGATACDLSVIGGTKKSATSRLSSMLSNWLKKYSEVYIIDMSPSGLHEKKSVNLLKLL